MAKSRTRAAPAGARVRRSRGGGELVAGVYHRETHTDLKVLAALRGQTMPDVLRDVAGEVIRAAREEAARQHGGRG